MKICYINPTFLVRRPIAELVDLFSEGNDVAVFLPKKLFKKPENKWHNDQLLRKAKIYTYSAINIPLINFEWPIPITPMFFINLVKIFSRYNTIHMWTYFYINSFFTLFFSLFFPKKRIILSCDTFPAYSFKAGKFTDVLFIIYTKLLGGFLFSIPDKIHIYGRSLVPYAKKAGVKEKRIVVIPTGINIEKFEKASSLERKKLGLEKDDFVMLYAGLIVPRKGIDIMLRTVKKLENVNIKLLLVGEGPSKKEYIKEAQSLGIKERVICTGWRKDIPSIMKMADVLFLPSRGEGLPGIIMEAMASGLPVLASDIPCIPDLVEDKKTGYLCKKDDINCFAARIKDIMKSKNTMGKKGKEKIRKFQWKVLKKDYRRLYVRDNRI